MVDDVSNVENMHQWVVGIGETRLVSGDGTAVRDRYEETDTCGGGTSDMDFEITAYDPPHRLGVTAPEGRSPSTGCWNSQRPTAGRV